MPRVAIHLGHAVYMECRRSGRTYRGLVVHGEIEVVPAQTASVWEPRDRDTALILALEPDLITHAAEDAGVPGGRVELLNRFHVRDAQIEHIGWAFKAEMEASYPAGPLFRDRLATALATCLVRHSSAAPMPRALRGGLPGAKLKLAISFIEDHLGQKLSLGGIAAVAGVSMTHFKAAFRESMGVPVHQYIIQRRVERAKALLRESRLSVGEIASQTGFAHQSHLAFHTRRMMGYSPRALRSSRQ
jgi:AraC family transcriptional regulator